MGWVLGGRKQARGSSAVASLFLRPTFAREAGPGAKVGRGLGEGVPEVGRGGLGSRIGHSIHSTRSIENVNLSFSRRAT